MPSSKTAARRVNRAKAETAHAAATATAAPVVTAVAVVTVARVAKAVVAAVPETMGAARAVMARQVPRAARRTVADAVIHNDRISLEQLAGEVKALWTLWALWNNPD